MPLLLPLRAQSGSCSRFAHSYIVYSQAGRQCNQDINLAGIVMQRCTSCLWFPLLNLQLRPEKRPQNADELLKFPWFASPSDSLWLE